MQHYLPVCRHKYSDLAFQQDMQVDETPYGKIRVYDIERSVCDCIRFRADIGEDMLHLIISNFLQRNSIQMDRLLAYADAMRVGKIVRTHLKQKEYQRVQRNIRGTHSSAPFVIRTECVYE